MASGNIQKIGVFTSGGDVPGMNACIRAVVRAGIYHGLKVFGICRGYDGMIDGQIEEMDSRSVSNIIQRGGTVLKSARSKRFMTKAGMAQAHDSLQQQGIEAVVAIGGDGTFKGALEFSGLYDIPFIGIPGTIDNDLYGTDCTIGYDTALNTAIEAVDKIRDTASSHDRLFFVEVMGRDAGFIALRTGIACGAEAILVPETTTDLDQLIKKLEAGWSHKKSSSIVIVAEGDDAGGAMDVARKVNEKFSHYDTRVTILGHLQRGGSPTSFDRVLASRLGVAAVAALLAGERNSMVGLWHRDVKYTPFEKAAKHHRDINRHLLQLAEILAI